MSDRPLESWIRDALYDHAESIIDALELKRPAEFWRWKEYGCEVGRIDLLIAWSGVVIVVEVKRDTADENAVAQVLRYAGAIEQSVWAAQYFKVLVARDFSAGACFAAVPASVTLLKAHPAVTLSEHADMPPSRGDLHESLFDVVCPEVRVVGPSESGPSSDDTASLVRRDPDSSEGSSADRVSAGIGSGHEN